jgi:hypothetical protein
MRNKVSSDWLPSYIKATRPVLEIFKLVGYFPDSPRTSTLLEWVCTYFVNVSRAVFFSSLALVFINCSYTVHFFHRQQSNAHYSYRNLSQKNLTVLRQYQRH